MSGRALCQLLCLSVAAAADPSPATSVAAAADPWPPATSATATVQDLHREYHNIFRYGNRNAASHLWSSFIFDRSASLSPEKFELMFSGFCAVSGPSDIFILN